MGALASAVDALTARFVAPSLREDADVERRARFVAAMNLVLVPIILVRVLNLIAADLHPQAAVAGATLVAMASSLWLLRRGRLVVAGNVLVFGLFAGAVFMLLRRGGIGAPMAVGIGALPLLATLVGGIRSGLTWMLLVFSVVLGIGIYEHGLGNPLPDSLPVTERIRVELVGALLFPIVLFCIGLFFERTKNAALEASARAERERIHAEEAASLLRTDRMASVGQLAAGIAHEVNNPLGYVAGNLDFIEAELRRLDRHDFEGSRTELVEAVAEARQGIRRVASIVRDLKTFARDDVQETGVIDVRAALDATIRIADNEIRHRARLVKTYPDHPTAVRANEARLVQVFLNLLVNATQAIPPGRADENRISVTVTSDEERIVVVVSDTGCGMSEDVLSRALEPFFTTKPVGVGTGLGLGVCNNVVRALGGSLHLESRVGEGTSVTVTLPSSNESPTAQPAPAVAVAASKEPLRVLLIDDDPLVIRALRRLLRRHDVTAVERGREAVSLIGDGHEYDVILCDLMMPELTGAEVYEQVASLGRGAERNFVFLTGGVFTDKLRTFLETVPNPRFEKPIRADHLERILTARSAAM